MTPREPNRFEARCGVHGQRPWWRDGRCICPELRAAESSALERAAQFVDDEDEGPHGQYSQLGDVSDFRARCVAGIRALKPPAAAPGWGRGRVNKAGELEFEPPAAAPAADYDPITAPIPEGDMNGPHGLLPAADGQAQALVASVKHYSLLRDTAAPAAETGKENQNDDRDVDHRRVDRGGDAGRVLQPGGARPDVAASPVAPAPPPGPWRIGSHYGIHVYCGEVPIATFHTVLDARRCVEAVNSEAQGAEAPDGATLIAAERKRQVEKEGWTPEHDDEHADGELADAAACYAMYEQKRPPRRWPWDPEWWKPGTDPIRRLAKAGALIAAEIDRLHREAEAKAYLAARAAPHTEEVPR